MLIKQLHLQNIGRHTKLTFDCAEPVVGILGENGVGKSTVLDMLEYLLTGETRDPIASYVRHGEGKGVASATFTKGGKEGYIMRSFGKSSARKLVWDGREMTSSKEVETTMREIFAADKKAIANAVFVNQGSLEKILFSDRESERRSMFIKLVNMSFCTQRVEVLTGKLRRLESTIVDLAPAMDAAKIVLQESHQAYQLAASVYNAMPDHLEEIAFCDGFMKAEEQLQDALARVEWYRNENTLHWASQDKLLASFGSPSYNEAKLHISGLERQQQERREKLAFFQSVKSALTHYHRVAGEVTELNRRLGALLTQQAQENPENLTLEQVQGKLQNAAVQVQLMETYNQTEKLIDDKHHQMTAKQQELAHLAHPDHSEEQLKEMFKLLQEAHGLLTFMRRTQTMQKEIMACLDKNLNLDGSAQVQCSKCGLQISNPDQLSLEAQNQLNQTILDMQKHYDDDHVIYVKAENAWRTYDVTSKRLHKEIDEINSAITQMETVQKTFQFKRTLEEFKTEVAQYTTLVTQIPATQQAIATVQQDLTAKMKAKKENTLAIAHLPQQTEYTDTAETALSAIVTNSDQALADKRDIFAEMTRLNTLLESSAKDLTKAQNESEKYKADLQKPMPAAVSSMSAQLQGNIAAVRQEMVTHQNVRQQAYGRVEEANSGYVRAQNQIKELELRAEADKDKRKVLEDLRALRELFEDDVLPMDVVKHHFTYLARLTQQYLTQLDADFSILIDPDNPIGFTFQRLDEPPHEPLPMNKLSGGQRVRLCTAFLIAVQQRLVKNVGLLVLDEPSVHLAESGVDALKQFLISLSEKLRNSEMQVWVCDHHPELKAGLNMALELK